MLKTGAKILLALALAAGPIVAVPQLAHAQTDAQRRAYDAGYQNGANDRNQNKPLNLKTGKWHGENLPAYRRGYQDGYRNAGRQDISRPGRDDDRDRYRDQDRDRDRDRDHDRNWDRDHDRNWDRDHDQDRDRGYNNGGYSSTRNWTDAQRRGYQAGFQNGVNDRGKNKPLNLKTGNWHNENLITYQQGYEDGYRGRGNRLYNNH